MGKEESAGQAPGDIEAGRRRLADIEASEARLRTLMRCIRDGVIATDSSGRITSMNAAAEGITGWSEAEAMGRPVAEVLRLIDAATRAAVESPVARVLRTGEALGIANQTLLTAKDGTERRSAGACNPIHNEKGELAGVVLVLFDQPGGREAEEELEARVRWNRSMVEHLPLRIFIKDLESVYVFCNANYASDLGASPEAVIGKDDFAFHPRELAEAYRADDRAVMLAGTRKDIEERYQVAGDERWIHTTKVPYRNKQEQVVGVLGIFEDITERRRAERGLTLFRTFIDNSNDAFEVVDVHTARFVDVNEKACRDLGYTREEYLSLSVFDVDPRVDGATFTKTCEEIRRSGSAVWKGVHRRKDGSTFPVEVSLSHVQLDREFMVTVVRDISDRERAEDALRRSLDTQAAIASILQLGLEDRSLDDLLQQVLRITISMPWLSVQGKGAILLADDPSGELVMRASVGLADEVKVKCARVPLGVCMCGRAAATGQLIHAANVDARHDNVYQGMTPHGHYCVPILAGNEVFGVLTTYVAAGHASSQQEQDFLISIANTLAGVLARRKAEAAKVRVMEQLRQAQKMDAIGNLAGGVAHDFNNLLSVILNFAGFALEGLHEGDPLRDDLLEVMKAGQRGAALTRQILAFSHAQTLQPASINLNLAVAAIEKMLRRIIGEDIALVQTLAPELDAVLVDPGQMDQVIMNLAVNARDAMPGGGTLTIETANAELSGDEVTLQAPVTPGRYTMLSVADTGTGMDEPTKARMFEPFFTTKQNGKGTGLGLATIYGIVTQSGGTISVASELGRGTTFKIYLPCHLSSILPKPSLLPPSNDARGTETILVVEDDEALRNVARRILGAAGYSVLTASNGGEALLVCESHPDRIHLLLTDVVMPLISGHALAERLTQVRPGLKVVFMSGYTGAPFQQHGVLEPPFHFIAKPFAPTDLTRKVRDVLDEA